jgi:hypothetical protein
MPAFLLKSGLVCLPLVIGICFAIAGFKAYRTRRLLLTDVERVQHHIELRDLGPGTNKPLPSPGDPAALPIAHPLPKPGADIKGVGGGLVQYFCPSSNPASKASATSHTAKSETGGISDTANLSVGLELPRAEDEDSIHHSTSQRSTDFDIPAPPRIYTSTNYGRYNSTEFISEVGESSTSAMYAHGDVRATETWKKIARRESLVGGRKFGSENTDSGMPVVLETAFSIGEGSDEERRSFDSGRRHFEGHGEGDVLRKVRAEDSGEGQGVVEDETVMVEKTAGEAEEDTHGMNMGEAIKAAVEGSPDHGETEEVDGISNHRSSKSSWSTDDSDIGTLPTPDNSLFRTSSTRDNITTPAEKVSAMYVDPEKFPGDAGMERRDSVSKPELAGYFDKVGN